jgi:hypothetical protein
MTELYQKQKENIKNWRENNREQYNAYLREYRKRKIAEGTWKNGNSKEYQKEYHKKYREKQKSAVKELNELKEKIKNIL